MITIRFLLVWGGLAGGGSQSYVRYMRWEKATHTLARGEKNKISVAHTLNELGTDNTPDRAHEEPTSALYLPHRTQVTLWAQLPDVL